MIAGAPGPHQNLIDARNTKNDEFYTQLQDIEDEVCNYRDHFRDKVVYCNCDDPRVSNFVRYFSRDFELLGLKKLIATCYKNQNPDLFSRHDCEKAIRLEYDGFRNGERVPRVEDIGVVPLDGDGDFRSPECIELLKQADIVVTNPPFSLFREYLPQLVEYDKKFLIIGPMNSITYKEVFPLIRDNKLWLGVPPVSRDMLFDIPSHHVGELLESKKEGSAYRMVGKDVKRRLGNAAWFTNLDHAGRHEEMILTKEYRPEDYPKYDNYNAIEVGKVADIPVNYAGAMGVPKTFLSKYNPDQFKILGVCDREDNSGLRTRVYDKSAGDNYSDLNRGCNIRVDGSLKPAYSRILICHKDSKQ